ncbi:hypothetical protein DXG03_003137 [Asterophora parasitica]|uniref:Uncharacterized protein n=1 Tax=Asterophora parasitica TaxID=117018 RepID=A0A9P7KI98_9AGAR|nr:hypothetical protein DXG03_003137 [Asterophora parasitica]
MRRYVLDFRHFYYALLTDEIHRHEFVFQMREAGNTPSALADFLADPYVVEFHRKQNENHNGLKDYRKMTSRMQKNLIEPQEHLVRFLKELLRNAADHLEYEMRRANDAELRAGFAELSAKDVAGKLAAAEGDKARADGAHVAERQLHRTQLEKTREELKGLRRDIRSAERLKDQFEGASIRAKEMNIHYRENISKWKRYEEGVQQGHEIEVANSFDEGRVRGWQEGFEEGRNTGHQEGLVAGMREGKEQGRKEERKNALEAFDKFLANEMGESDDRVSAAVPSA